MKKPALGKGLDAILGPRREIEPTTQSERTREQESREGGDPRLVEIEKVSAGRGQPRRIFREEAIDELASSIREKGVIQPLVVTRSGSGYELIAGERRLRAAARAGLSRVPVIVKAEIAPAELVELALVENVQREDLTPLELARAYQRLVDQYRYTQDELAKKIGKSRASVANTLRLLALPEPVRDALEQGLITEGHARALLSLQTAALQISVCRAVARKGLSVRETEDLVRSESGRAGAVGRDSKGPRGRSADPLIASIESAIGDSLGTKVRIRGGKDRGRVELHFFSRGELDGLVQRLTAK
jgi:ParB family chromosome partitioning protein